MANEHSYKVTIEWTGNTGQGTKDYRSYERSHSILSEKKTNLLCSSDPAFRGDPTKWNPEELLLSSLSSCHMLWYLHLCSEKKIVVTKYVDHAVATMAVESTGAGRFQEATLYPIIEITDPSRISEAEKLHEGAHKKCFIANSINFPVKVVASITASAKDVTTA